VFAPQHTHPHPSFSPDGQHVVYTSDRSGFAQVYEVTIHAAMLRDATAAG
jgi:oligogalacturonide lyase